MSWPRLVANAGVGILLLPPAAMFALIELHTVDRAQCNWQTFDYICSDYERAYGTLCGALLLVWAMVTWAINRTRKNSH